MAGIWGMDDFITGLNSYVDNLGKLDGLAVSVEPADTLATVEAKLRGEIQRAGAAGFSDSEIHSLAKSLFDEGRG